ncbi:hypothetical protein GCM10022209_60120 [Chitinophaga oryziterrae]
MHLFSNNSSEAVEALIDIDRYPVKEVPAIRIKGYHFEDDTNSFKKLASTI